MAIQPNPDIYLYIYICTHIYAHTYISGYILYVPCTILQGIYTGYIYITEVQHTLNEGKGKQSCFSNYNKGNNRFK